MSTTAWSDACFATLRPRPRLRMSEWADRYRVIPPGTSPEPAEWRTSRTPYLAEIMDTISDPRTESVAIMAGSQVGKSETVLNAIGYYSDADPSPILLVRPTEGDAKSFSKERVDPMFRHTPSLMGKLSDGLRDRDNTVLMKMFPGGYLAVAWATSAVTLASRPIRVLLCDEVDKYLGSTGTDGDPVAQAIQRTANFPNRKIVLVSTPTIDGVSRIADAYEESDQRRYHVPCPHCGFFQVLRWGQVIYKNDAGEVDLEHVHYRCAQCSCAIEEHHRPKMLAAGKWIAEFPERKVKGFHISGLLSPWVRWGELAEQWIAVWKNRDKAGQQEFVNLRLGEPWVEDTDAIHVEGLERNREHYDAEVPDGALVLTAGVDVQDNRLEVEVVGWGVGRESWGVAYRVLAGDTSTPGVWARLDELLAKTWARADGSKVGLWCVCVDSGGHRTTEVYEFSRARLARNIFAIKGQAGPGRPIAGKPTTSNQLRVPLYPVGVDTAKEALYSRLLLRDHGPGYCHFPRDVAAAYDTGYFEGLISERRRVKIRGGRRVHEWVAVRDRNEPLDCRVYATAAMEILNPDFEALAGLPRAVAAAGGARRGRRVFSRGI